jgi:hypothetical protein
MITHDLIERNVLSIFTSGYGGTSTISPEEKSIDDLSGVSEFILLSIPYIKDKPRRQLTGPPTGILEVQCQCWTRNMTDLYAVQKLGDSVSDLWHQKTYPVRDYTTGGNPVVGYLQFHECQHFNQTDAVLGDTAIVGKEILVRCPATYSGV